MKLGINESAVMAGYPLSRLKPFDTVTVLGYWDRNETDVDAALRRCKNAGFNVALHPVIYHLEAVEGKGFYSKPFPERSAAYWARLKNALPAPVKLDAVDVVNEPHHTNMLPEAAGFYSMANSRVRRLNEYGILEDAQFSRMWLDMLRESAALYDVIGVQAHVMAPPDAMPPMDVIRERLERYAALGKPIHVSEVSVPSGRLGWDERQQADWLEHFYMTCAKIPQIELFGYWDLRDSEAWNKTSGLIRKDGTFKPAYNRLMGLAGKDIEEREPEPEPVPWWVMLWQRFFS
jgi:hypothetical protein